MTLAATLLPATAAPGKPAPGKSTRIANAHRSPAEHLAGLLDAIVLDGNVRAMEGVACVLARAGAGMQDRADDLLAREQRTHRLPLAATPSRRMAERTARRALAGAVEDPSRGANRFHRYGDLPDWAARLKPVAHLGEIVFYRAAPEPVAGSAGA